jgi:hypothetical protein
MLQKPGEEIFDVIRWFGSRGAPAVTHTQAAQNLEEGDHIVHDPLPRSSRRRARHGKMDQFEPARKHYHSGRCDR